MAQTKTPRTETTITLRDADWIVSGIVSHGTPHYFCRSFGNWLPGDPDEVEDVELVADGHDGALSFDDLTDDERAEVDTALLEASAGEYEAAYEDEMERRADADRDDRRFGEGRYERDAAYLAAVAGRKP